MPQGWPGEFCADWTYISLVMKAYKPEVKERVELPVQVLSDTVVLLP